jgi:hypothetical protein
MGKKVEKKRANVVQCPRPLKKEQLVLLTGGHNGTGSASTTAMDNLC